MEYNRGGRSLKVGDIGRLSCCRQHLIWPGERMRPAVRGTVRLSGLRQQTQVYLHARLDAFVAPLRWYWSDFPTYLKDGLTTSEVIPTLTGSWLTQTDWTANLGIGRLKEDFCTWYAQHPINVWNEWYRWPEDAKANVAVPDINFFANHGPACVNLPFAGSRLHTQPTLDPSEYQVSSATNFDVRDLARVQSLFHQAAVTDWTSNERYLAFMRDLYGAEGSNEVDQVPIRLRQGAELTVSPSELYAQDGASLGEVASFRDFSVNHAWNEFVAPEHMICCYMLLLRFAPIFDDGVAPGVYPGRTDYEVYQGDPVVLSGQQPTSVRDSEIKEGLGNVIGYLPYGWQLREGFSHVDERYALLNNFPLLETSTNTAAAYRDASNISDCFRSTALRHWNADLEFNIPVSSAVPSAGQSIVAGSDRRGPAGNHPTGGWLV